MIKLSVAIMSVPSRAGHVAEMVETLARQARRAVDKGIWVQPTAVNVDHLKEGPWVSWRNAWNLRHAEATHHVVLQDDLWFCADFQETMVELIAARPRDVISGFLPRASVAQAAKWGVPWVMTMAFLWAQCVMMPVPVGEYFIEWVAEQERLQDPAITEKWGWYDDTRMGAFFKETGRPVYIPVPHPVNHIAEEIGGSTLGHNFGKDKRQAQGGSFRGVDVPLAGINWAELSYVKE